MTIVQGSKISVVDPISKKKEKGVVTSVANGFYEIAMDSKRTLVIERAEFNRYGIKLLDDQSEVIVTDILLHGRKRQLEASKKKKTSNETWKSFERQVAEDFHTQRNALSGMWKGVSGSDSLHPHIYIECKYRDSFPFWDSYVAESEKDCRERMQGRLRQRTTVMVVTDFKVYRGDLWFIHKDNFFDCLEHVSVLKSEEGVERLLVIRNKFNLWQGNKYKSMLSLFKDTEDKAENEGKIPVVAVKMKNRSGYMIGTNPKYFSRLLKTLNKTNYNE